MLKVGVESAAPPSAPRGDVPGRLEAGDGVVVDEVDERAPRRTLPAPGPPCTRPGGCRSTIVLPCQDWTSGTTSACSPSGPACGGASPGAGNKPRGRGQPTPRTSAC